jgi:hypothetical protein
MSKRETLTSTFELKLASDGEEAVIEGYGSTFDVDRVRDRVAPGAFTKSLATRPAAKVKMLWNHNPDEPIGVWTSITEDAKGLKVKGRLITETARGREVHALLKAGAVEGLSIGFITKTDEYDRTQKVRTIKEADLYEISVVAFPANEAATLTSIKTDSAPGLVRALNAASAAFQEEVR